MAASPADGVSRDIQTAYRQIRSAESKSVTRATVIGGDGNISESTKEACLREVRRHKFARTGTANAEGGSATITFVFKDPK